MIRQVQYRVPLRLPARNLYSEEGKDQRIRACKENTVLESDFDEVLGQDATQRQVFAAAQGCMDSVLEGYNGSILAYGATGSGKTFTMLGSLNESADDDSAGLIPRSLKDLFAKTAQLGSPDDRQHCRICMSYVEIYNERLHDLLQPYKPNARLDPQDVRKRKAGLEVKERHGQTCVPGALLVRVDTIQAALSLVRKGNLSRAVRHTEMNQQSSRSHTMLQVVVEQRLRGSMLRSKLNFVDLAGSERWSERVEMSGVRVSEMTSINQSLSTLITVVASLTEEGRSHIPYRDSKLTHLLQDSLGGNCNTTIIATISPSTLAFEETCATLRFADRARNIVNRATVNLHTDYKLELELKTAEVKRLTSLLAKFAGMVDSNGRMPHASGGNDSHSSGLSNIAGVARPGSSAAAMKDKQRRRSMTEAEPDVDDASSSSRNSDAETPKDRPATSSNAASTGALSNRAPDRAASSGPLGPSALPRAASDKALARNWANPSHHSPALPNLASEQILRLPAKSDWQNSSMAASASLAEVGRLRAELLLAKEDLLAERAARLRLESVVVASQHYFSQRNPQHAAVPDSQNASELGDADPFAADNSAGSASVAASAPFSRIAAESFSSMQHVGRSSLFPLQTSSSSSAVGRTSLQGRPEALSRSYSGGGNSAATRSAMGQPCAALYQRHLPSEASVSSFHDDVSEGSPLIRNQSGSWGRSSINHSPDSHSRLMQAGAISAFRDADTAFERHPGMTHAAGTKPALVGEASGTSAVSSPYSSKFARSPMTSKPSSPYKRSHAANLQHPLSNSSGILKDSGSLDAGSWIYILGNRGSSLTAKQLAKSSKAASNVL